VHAEHTPPHNSGHRPWLNRFVWFLAALTLLLICSGGLVTSKGVGLAVPDWPTTFGYNMFAFPFSEWVGGIFYEHSHRLIASIVGFLTIILAVWLWFADSRRWMRILGVVALVAVIVQGVLGGLRVTMLKDELGIFHACLAQSFLCLLVFIGVARSRLWNGLPAAGSTPLLWLPIVTSFIIFAQLALGATMRHQHRDLAILDFPLAYGEIIPDVSPERLDNINRWRTSHALSEVEPSHIWLQMAHRIVALVIATAVVWYALALRRTANAPRPLLTLSSLWVFFLALQITLGAWTIWTNKAADVATAHVAVGAAMLALGVSIWAISARTAAARQPVAARAIPVPQELPA
jgi:heme a synthase